MFHIPLQQIGEHWDDSPQSKEEVEASLLHKQEAAMRRERALAYAYSHQVFSGFLNSPLLKIFET